jgi:SAM-dependent methyltransferase
MRVTHCRVCESTEMALVLDLGETALANRFVRPEQLSEPEPKYPLRLVLCRRCGLVQIDEEVPREVLFKDYVYFSGTSDLVHQHAERLAKSLCTQYGVHGADLVLEPASNDGTVLKAFQRRGLRVLGVEPAENIAAVARAEGIETVTEFFDANLARKLKQSHGRAKLLLARHVLAHVTDLHGFVRGIHESLAWDGVAVIEAPYVAELLCRLEFDTIYHEHLCYFSLRVLKTLFERFGLSCVDAELVAMHGGSLLLHVAHADGPHHASLRLRAMLAKEESLGLATLETWQKFATRVAELKEQLLHFFDDATYFGQTVVGYGAPAKANTLLAYCDIGPGHLPYIVDRSPYKQGLLTPGQHIPVRHPRCVLEDQPDVLLILAWNFADEIMAQQDAYWRCGGRFAVPIPSPGLIRTAIAA